MKVYLYRESSLIWREVYVLGYKNRFYSLNGSQLISDILITWETLTHHLIEVDKKYYTNSIKEAIVKIKLCNGR